jgi:pyruvate,water dikinase
MTPLHEAEDASRFGGKASGLAGLMAAGLRVPSGFALAAEQVRVLVAGGSFDEAWSAAAALPAPLAVRSSAVDEDSAEHSFAGQHLTVLGVDGREAFERAVLDVAASHAGSAGYRDKRGLDSDAGIAVVVQSLITPVAAGVIFTRHPVSGDEVTVIEASWGLGEVVVAGMVTPDHFEVGRDGAISSREAGIKDVRLVYRGAGTVEEEVPEADVERLCIDDPVVDELVALVPALEAVAGGGADGEWAWDGTQLHVLQCRPITTLG